MQERQGNNVLKIDFWNLLFTIINLLVLFIAVKLLLFKPVRKIIAQRQEEADKQFEQAKKQQEEADALKVKYEQSLAEAEEAKKQALVDARKSAGEEYQRIVSEAKEAAKTMKKDAAAEAESQKAQILKKAETEIADMVVDATAKMIGGQKGAEVDSALYDKFLEKAGDKA